MVVYFDTVHTASDIDASSDALAVALGDGGVARGDRIAIYMQNVSQYVIVLIAAWKVGAIAVAINPMLKPREVAKLLADSTPVAFVALSELYSDELAATLGQSTVSRVITSSGLEGQAGGDARVLPGRRMLAPAGTEDLRDLLLRYAGRVPEPAALHPDDVAVIDVHLGHDRSG